MSTYEVLQKSIDLVRGAVQSSMSIDKVVQKSIDMARGAVQSSVSIDKMLQESKNLFLQPRVLQSISRLGDAMAFMYICMFVAASRSSFVFSIAVGDCCINMTRLAK